MKGNVMAAVAAVLLTVTLAACHNGHGGPTHTTDSEPVGSQTTGSDNKGELTVDLDDKGTLTMGGKGTSTVSLSEREGMPLFKRQSYFVDGSANFSRFTPYLAEMRARSARFAMPLVGGDPVSEIETHMKQTQYSVSGYGNIIRKYTTPLWIMMYVEDAITDEAKAINKDNAMWYEPNYDIYNAAWAASAQYMASHRMRSLYEVWNEPDQPNYMWYSGWDGYIRLYQNSANAVRNGDPDAFVGGPCVSLYNKTTYLAFLDAVQANRTPLDFVSAHYYTNTSPYTLETMIRNLKEGLGNEFPETQILFTEFNVHIPPNNEWGCAFENRTDFTLQKAEVVVPALNAIKTFNENPDITEISWAYLFNGNGSLGMIDPKGNRSPLYHALNLYAHMPTQSVKTTIKDGTEVSAFASSDETGAGIMLWNTSDKKAQTLELAITDIPYDTCTVSIYRIDSKHSAYYDTKGKDDLELVTKMEKVTADSLCWEGKLPVGGVVYIAIEADQLPTMKRENRVGDVARVDYYYRDRFGSAYSDFDPQSSTATVGTGDHEEGRGLTAVTYWKIDDVVHVKGSFWNEAKALSDTSCLSVRIDYHTDKGYTKAVAYSTLSPAEDRRTHPFGTEKAPDLVIIPDSMEAFDLAIKDNAPADWDGKVILSFDIEGTGSWTEATFRLES